MPEPIIWLTVREFGPFVSFYLVADIVRGGDEWHAIGFPAATAWPIVSYNLSQDPVGRPARGPILQSMWL
jgi:hypothetical protein